MVKAKKTSPKTKKTTTKRKKTTRKSPKKTVMQSFKRSPEPEPFMTFKITQQTVYWVIITLLSATFMIWLLKIQSDITVIYNQVEQMQRVNLDMPITPKK